MEPIGSKSVVTFYTVLSNEEVVEILRGWKDKDGEIHYEHVSKGWFLRLKDGPTVVTAEKLPFEVNNVVRLELSCQT